MARTIHYWKVLSNTSGDLSFPRELKNKNWKSLILEQDFLLTLIRLCLGLLTGDLVHHFKVANSLVSTVFITWLRLVSLELRWLIYWHNCNIIRRNLPSMFRKYYPNCCVIIDCSELFIETPSSQDEAAACWSNYKHHHTVKYLKGIALNGTVSYLSDCSRGRTSDIFIVREWFFTKATASGSSYGRQRVQDTRHASILSIYSCYFSIKAYKYSNDSKKYIKNFTDCKR